jgi:hypothetical protein
MRHLGVLAAALSSLAIATPAQAAKVGVAPTSPGIVDLMALRGHAFALVQVRRGRRVPGAELVSRRLGIWRLRTARSSRTVSLSRSARSPTRSRNWSGGAGQSGPTR